MQGQAKRPESVLVVVYTEAGEVLLLRRREPSDFWQSVTGSLEWDESPAAAALRELGEETGLTTPAPRASGHRQRFEILPAWRARYADGVRENLEHEFRVRVPEPVPIRINPAEHLEYVWLPAAEAALRATSWTNRAAIERLAEGEGGEDRHR